MAPRVEFHPRFVLEVSEKYSKQRNIRPYLLLPAPIPKYNGPVTDRNGLKSISGVRTTHKVFFSLLQKVRDPSLLLIFVSNYITICFERCSHSKLDFLIPWLPRQSSKKKKIKSTTPEINYIRKHKMGKKSNSLTNQLPKIRNKGYRRASSSARQKRIKSTPIVH